jgi:GH24 family phage-related lysozyme (muramidase)
MARKIGPRATTLIKSFEGFSLKAYPDPATGGDPWTVGWGSTGKDIKRGTVWTVAQAEERFAAHVAEFEAGVDKAIGDTPTTAAQFGAMVSLAYNIGLGNFRSSTLLKKHIAGDYAAAAGQFVKWNKAAGKVMAGLTRRREAEAKLYEGGSE